MSRYFNIILVDIVLLIILSAISFFLISFYRDANYLNTGYADWLVHAFRLKSLDQHGFLSWSHTWSNGIALWQSYQFIPHYLTLPLVQLLSFDYGRAMVIMTIIQFVFLRILIYTLLRLLRFSPLTSFACALSSLAIAQYWTGVSDFSLQFASLFFPIIITLWIMHLNGRLQILFVFLVGISFYIHPILGFFSALLWLTGLFLSDRKIITLQTFGEFVVLLIASSFFWVPLVIRDSYTYSNSYFSSRAFFQQTLQADWLGLSITLFLALFIAIISSFSIHTVKRWWTRVLVVYAVVMLGLIYISLTIDLPSILLKFQYSRGITLIGIAIVFALAPAFENMFKSKSSLSKYFLIFFIAFVILESLWITSVYPPQTIKKLQDPIEKYIKDSKSIDIHHSHVWSSSLELTSYFSPSVLMPVSYMGHLDSNQVSPRLGPLITYQIYPEKVPQSNIERINDYFKISGVKFAFFEETSPFVASLSDTERYKYKDLGPINLTHSIYHGYEVPWQPRNAVLIDSSHEKDLSAFPIHLEINNINDQTLLDDSVKKFVSIIYNDRNIPLAIDYPTQETVRVVIPKDRTSNFVYINTSFAKSWKATLDGKEQKIQPVGPNYMLVQLTPDSTEGTLILRHTWPLTNQFAAFAVIACGVSILVYNSIYPFLRKKRGKTTEDIPIPHIKFT